MTLKTHTIPLLHHTGHIWMTLASIQEHRNAFPKNSLTIPPIQRYELVIMKVTLCKHPARPFCCQEHPEGAGVASRYREFPLNLETPMQKQKQNKKARGGTLPGT